MGRGVGLSKNIKHDDNIEVDEVTLKENTTYNEYCAAQGLVHLSSDQPKQGDIHKLHDKSQDIIKSVDEVKKLVKKKMLIKKKMLMKKVKRRRRLRLLSQNGKFMSKRK